MNCPNDQAKMSQAGYLLLAPDAGIKITHWVCPECGLKIPKRKKATA